MANSKPRRQSADQIDHVALELRDIARGLTKATRDLRGQRGKKVKNPTVVVDNAEAASRALKTLNNYLNSVMRSVLRETNGE